MRTTRHCNSRLYFLHKSITSLKKWYYLKNEELTPNLGWQNIQPHVKEFDEADLVFDDTVLDKRLASKYRISAPSI
jgi:hypothetical protein